MSLPQIPVFYHPMNPSSLIQTAAGQPQNIMISSGNPGAGSITPGSAPFHYSAVYSGKLPSIVISMICFFFIFRSSYVQFIFIGTR